MWSEVQQASAIVASVAEAVEAYRPKYHGSSGSEHL